MTRLEIVFNLWRGTWGLSHERACRLLNLPVWGFQAICTGVAQGNSAKETIARIYHQDRTMRNAHCVIGRVRLK